MKTDASLHPVDFFQINVMFWKKKTQNLASFYLYAQIFLLYFERLVMKPKQQCAKTTVCLYISIFCSTLSTIKAECTGGNQCRGLDKRVWAHLVFVTIFLFHATATFIVSGQGPVGGSVLLGRCLPQGSQRLAQLLPLPLAYPLFDKLEPVRLSLDTLSSSKAWSS